MQSGGVGVWLFASVAARTAGMAIAAKIVAAVIAHQILLLRGLYVAAGAGCVIVLPFVFCVRAGYLFSMPGEMMKHPLTAIPDTVAIAVTAAMLCSICDHTNMLAMAMPNAARKNRKKKMKAFSAWFRVIVAVLSVWLPLRF